MVGYGPWMLTGYVTNQYATLTANKDFFMGAPKFHTLIIQYFTNRTPPWPRCAAASSTRSIQPDRDAVQGAQGRQEHRRVPAGLRHLDRHRAQSGRADQKGQEFRHRQPGPADPRVRQAIELAINKHELVTKIWDGLAVAGSGYLPPAYPQWQWTPPASEQMNYDPAKANQILTAAGYKMGPNGVRIDPKTHKPLVLRLGIHSDESTDARWPRTCRGG